MFLADGEQTIRFMSCIRALHLYCFDQTSHRVPDLLYSRSLNIYGFDQTSHSVLVGSLPYCFVQCLMPLISLTEVALMCCCDADAQKQQDMSNKMVAQYTAV